MIEKIIQELQVKRESLSSQIHFLNVLSYSGEFVGFLSEKTNSHEYKFYFYYVPDEQQGVIVRKDNSGINVVSYGSIKKKNFVSYYKTQKHEEKALKLFPLSWPYLKYLISKERWLEKKYLNKLKKESFN